MIYYDFATLDFATNFFRDTDFTAWGHGSDQTFSTCFTWSIYYHHITSCCFKFYNNTYRDIHNETFVQ